MITDELKDWLAINAGIGDCYSPGAIHYTDPDGIARQGSTGDVLNAFTVAHLVGKDDAIIIANTNYTQLKTINDNNDTTINDVKFAYDNDGDPAGEPKYCKGVPSNKTTIDFSSAVGGVFLHEENWGIHEQLPATITVDNDTDYAFEIQRPAYTAIMYSHVRVSSTGQISCLNVDGDVNYCNKNTSPGMVVNDVNKSVIFYPPAPDTPDTPSDLAGTHVFIGPPEGQPSITLDLSNLEMRQNESDYHFEMNDILITSTSPQKIYIALEVRLFPGAHNACPTSGASFIGMDRVSTSRNIRIKVLDPGEVETINADFYQPEALRGIHTVCLLVHGTWTRTELETEVAVITG